MYLFCGLYLLSGVQFVDVVRTTLLSLTLSSEFRLSRLHFAREHHHLHFLIKCQSAVYHHPNTRW